jgi:hypothetical protein
MKQFVDHNHFIYIGTDAYWIILVTLLEAKGACKNRLIAGV